MNSRPAIAFFSALLAITSVGAADKSAKKPRPKPIVSPTLHDDHSATFRLQACKAQKVEVGGQPFSKRLPLTKGTNNVWSVTSKSIPPGIYEYSFYVDGLQMLDPGNPQIKPMRSPKTSILYIPGGNIFDFRSDIAHGSVHYHGYYSKPIKRFRELQVYTPPGYETGKSAYPLLVLQHGHSDSFATWVAHGKAHWILDNLIADGKAVPMIVIMLDGHPVPESYGDGRSTANTEELRRDLMREALPMIEKLYRVKPGSANRAITGLSMGGLHSLTIGFQERHAFDWLGAFSAAVPTEEDLPTLLTNPKDLNSDYKLIWIAIGKDDFLLKENKRMIALLKEKSIRHEFLLTEGGHSWPIWRDYLARFVPRLFKD